MKNQYILIGFFAIILLASTKIVSTELQLSSDTPTNATINSTSTSVTPVPTTPTTTSVAPANTTTTTTPVAPANTTTTSNTTSAASTIPSTTTTAAPGRKFDGLSFVGGMILAVGLGALIYLVIRYLRRSNRLPYSNLR